MLNNNYFLFKYITWVKYLANVDFTFLFLSSTPTFKLHKFKQKLAWLTKIYCPIINTAYKIAQTSFGSVHGCFMIALTILLMKPTHVSERLRETSTKKLVRMLIITMIPLPSAMRVISNRICKQAPQVFSTLANSQRPSACVVHATRVACVRVTVILVVQKCRRVWVNEALTNRNSPRVYVDVNMALLLRQYFNLSVASNFTLLA